jgi:hypothetical protein
MTYRRGQDADTWHWCANCSHWPTADYIERNAKLGTGELCKECMAKDLTRNCQPAEEVVERVERRTVPRFNRESG